jgi:hypothetical protein
VAAGPAKVGENCPKLDDVITLVGALVVLVTGAAAVPLETRKRRLTTITITMTIEKQIDLCLALILVNIEPSWPDVD